MGIRNLYDEPRNTRVKVRDYLLNMSKVSVVANQFRPLADNDTCTPDTSNLHKPKQPAIFFTGVKTNPY